MGCTKDNAQESKFTIGDRGNRHFEGRRVSPIGYKHEGMKYGKVSTNNVRKNREEDLMSREKAETIMITHSFLFNPSSVSVCLGTDKILFGGVLPRLEKLLIRSPLC